MLLKPAKYYFSFTPINQLLIIKRAAISSKIRFSPLTTLKTRKPSTQPENKKPITIQRTLFILTIKFILRLKNISYQSFFYAY